MSSDKQPRWSISQQSAIDVRGENVIVSAGAGSGKTSVLVERVVQCVLDDPAVDISRLLVVTFTEAAAAEMRKRIGERLSGMAEEAALTGQNELYRRLARQISQLEQAQISTLHSFCMQVVRQNYLRLEIDPAFDIISEDDAVLMKTACLEQVMEAKLAQVSDVEADEGAVSNGSWGPSDVAPEANAEFIQMLDMFGAGDPKNVFPLVFRLDTFARSQSVPRAWLDAIRQNYATATSVSLTELPWYGAFAAWCERQLADARDAMEEARQLASGIGELTKYSVYLNDAMPLLLEASNALERADFVTVTGQLSAILSLKTPSAKKNPDDATVEDIKEQVKALRTQALNTLKPVAAIVGRGIDALIDDIAQMAPAIHQLVGLVEAFESAFMLEKRRNGQLDFNDLEHFAFEVLTDDTTGEARRLQEQYVEIFVDEFQDTSPIQDALVAAIAREEGNVFVVGDVKQSIYRFRMAEPGLFLDKYFGRSQTGVFRPLHLSDNYRSRQEVVNVVNFIFAALFSEEFGGAPYDDEARMQYAARYPATGQEMDLSGSIEVHLVERREKRRGAAEDEGARESPTIEGHSTAGRPIEVSSLSNLDMDESTGAASGLTGESDGELVSQDDLLAIEREGQVIASRIEEWMGQTGKPRRHVWDAKLQAYRPLEYRDIVILLRSVKGRMTPLLDIFRNHDIPAYGVTSTGFYGSLEIQWLLCALAAVDNPRREIELVATMRSPMGGFTDSELADIRHLSKGNFYDAFRMAAEAAPAASLALSAHLLHKARDFNHRLNSWRRLSRRAATEAVLARILEDTGLVDYLAAMTGGRVRVANVQTLLERVRNFDRSSVDGVFGFVTQARQLLQHEVDLGEARTLAEAEDVVRIMTIHQSKGLEFPVVFVADLGKQFYRNPLERALPLHRSMGFGPQRIDPRTDQRWRTLPSIAIEEAETTEFLAEEARILYVALTRARERLVLVGSARDLEKTVAHAMNSAGQSSTVLPRRILLKAKTALDWLLPTLWRDNSSATVFGQFLVDSGLDRYNHAGMSPKAVNDTSEEDRPNFSVHIWNSSRDDGELEPTGRIHHTPSVWSHRLIAAIQTVDSDEVTKILRQAEQVANEMNPDEATSSTASDTLQHRERECGLWQRGDSGLKFIDEGQQKTSPPAKVSATELRRLWGTRHRANQPAIFQTRGTAENLLEDPSWVQQRRVTGRERGLAFHSVMQVIDLSTVPNAAAVQAEIERLEGMGAIPPEVAEAVEGEDVVRFLRSRLGVAVRKALDTTGRVYREQPFFHRIDLERPDERAGERAGARASGGTGDFITVQGVMDCLAELPDKWLLIDYKTDNIEAKDALVTAEEYAAQVSVYVEVAKAVVGTGKPVEAYVYFVHPALAVPLRSVDVGSLFR